jgi:dodecin
VARKTVQGEEAAAVAVAIAQFEAEFAGAATSEAPAIPRLAARCPAGGRQRQGDDRGPTRRIRMAVVKIIELVGSSKTSTDDAAKQALLQAQGSLRNIRAVDIVSTGIRGENLDEYRAHVRVAFLIEGTEVD